MIILWVVLLVWLVTITYWYARRCAELLANSRTTPQTIPKEVDFQHELPTQEATRKELVALLLVVLLAWIYIFVGWIWGILFAVFATSCLKAILSRLQQQPHNAAQDIDV